MESIILNILGVLVGGLITILAARMYYEKASADLVTQAKELKKLNELMLRAIENAGLAEFQRDKNGDIEGLRITFSAALKCESSVSANLARSSSDEPM